MLVSAVQERESAVCIRISPPFETPSRAPIPPLVITEHQAELPASCLFTRGGVYVHAESLQSCLTLWDPMDYSPPGSSVHGDSPGKNTGVDCHFLLQGIFPTQGSNLLLLGLLHWQDSLPRSQPGKPSTVCRSMLISQFVPPSSLPTVSTSPFSASASPFLPCRWVRQYPFYRCHIYVLKFLHF